jgi:hypothetical protein
MNSLWVCRFASVCECAIVYLFLFCLFYCFLLFYYLFNFVLFIFFFFFFQSYIVCELHEKLSILLSFLRTHLNTKTMIFVQTCKQVSLEFCTDLQTSQPWFLLIIHVMVWSLCVTTGAFCARHLAEGDAGALSATATWWDEPAEEDWDLPAVFTKTSCCAGHNWRRLSRTGYGQLFKCYCTLLFMGFVWRFEDFSMKGK